MQSEVLLLYSDHSNACKKFKNLLSSLLEYSQNTPQLKYIISNVKGVNIDSEKVKKIIKKSTVIDVNVVPTLLIIHPDQRIEQYEGKTAFDFVNQYLQNPVSNMQHHPTSNMQHHPASNMQHHPASNMQHHPVSNMQHHPASNMQHHPASNMQHHPAMANNLSNHHPTMSNLQSAPNMLSQNNINTHTSTTDQYQSHHMYQQKQYSKGIGTTSLNLEDTNINDINKEVSNLISLSDENYSEHPLPAMTTEMNIQKMASGKPAKSGMQSMLDQAREMAKSREGADKPIHTMGEVASRSSPTTSLQISSDLTELSGMN